MRLFSERGFDDTTVEDIAREAGVSRRTFFRYFDTKSDVLWHAFDAEVATLRAAFAAAPAEEPLLDAIRTAVVSVNHYTATDMPELRARMKLISTVPALQASAATHYDAWERAVIDYAAGRLGQPPDALLPLAIGRATLAVCRAAYEVYRSIVSRWSAMSRYAKCCSSPRSCPTDPRAVTASCTYLPVHSARVRSYRRI